MCEQFVKKDSMRGHVRSHSESGSLLQHSNSYENERQPISRICSESSSKEIDFESSCESFIETSVLFADNSGSGINIGPYKFFRDQLDYTHHSIYTPERQSFQDDIITKQISEFSSIRNGLSGLGGFGEVKKRKTSPSWIITAGAPGSGKSSIMTKISENVEKFASEYFYNSNIDNFRHLLLYSDENRYASVDILNSKLTNKEAGYISEIIDLIAFDLGINVISNLTLNKIDWLLPLIETRKQLGYNIIIIYVDVLQEKAIERSISRVLKDGPDKGRTVSQDLIEKNITNIPKSIETLKQLLNPIDDFVITIDNNADSCDDSILQSINSEVYSSLLKDSYHYIENIIKNGIFRYN